MDKKKMAALLEREGIKGGQKSRVMAGFLLMLESMNQPAPELESGVPTVTVGVLRAEKPEDVSQCIRWYNASCFSRCRQKREGS